MTPDESPLPSRGRLTSAARVAREVAAWYADKEAAAVARLDPTEVVAIRTYSTAFAMLAKLLEDLRDEE